MTKWKFVDYQPEKGKTFFADIIRYDDARDRVKNIGRNEVVSNGKAGWQTFEVPKAKQIKVEKGWAIAIHYEELDEDLAVVPTTTDTGKGIDMVATGFEIMVDDSEINNLARVGQEPDVNIKGVLGALNIKMGQTFRTPALAAIIEPN